MYFRVENRFLHKCHPIRKKTMPPLLIPMGMRAAIGYYLFPVVHKEISANNVMSQDKQVAWLSLQFEIAAL